METTKERALDALTAGTLMRAARELIEAFENLELPRTEAIEELVGAAFMKMMRREAIRVNALGLSAEPGIGAIALVRQGLEHEQEMIETARRYCVDKDLIKGEEAPLALVGRQLMARSREHGSTTPAPSAEEAAVQAASNFLSDSDIEEALNLPKGHARKLRNRIKKKF